MTHGQIGQQYGVSRQYIGQLNQDRAAEVDAIRRDLDDEFAGLWIASKAARLAALAEEYQRASNSSKAGHFEWIRTRMQILHATAEELGQLPPRMTTVVVPVAHVIEGVDTEALK